jgi:hypothetical protein
MAQFYLDPRRESETTALPDAEVFHMSEDDIREAGPDSVWYETEGNYTGQPFVPGWYWWACFPGCLPDGEPNGPFDSEVKAVANARAGISFRPPRNFLRKGGAS